MPNTSEQWFVPLEEPNEPITIYGGQRGGGKIFALENIIAFLKESLNQANQETERWKSAALYYHEILATAPKWIPVTERLPKEHRLVLCRWTRGIGASYGLARYNHDNDVWYVSNEGMPEVTHWMPLPQPPKGE